MWASRSIISVIAMGNAFSVFLIRSLHGLSSRKSVTADVNNLISKAYIYLYEERNNAQSYRKHVIRLIMYDYFLAHLHTKQTYTIGAVWSRWKMYASHICTQTPKSQWARGKLQCASDCCTLHCSEAWLWALVTDRAQLHPHKLHNSGDLLNLNFCSQSTRIIFHCSYTLD